MTKKKLKPKKKAFGKLLLFLGIIIILVGCFFATKLILKKINGDIKLLNLELIGDKEINLKIGDEYTALGATASYEDLDLTDNIEVDSNIDLEHVGSYKYTYKIKYKKIDKEIERVVNVLDDTLPTIKLKGRGKVMIVVGNEYTDLGATATDNYDGDLTDKITVDKENLDINTVGEYKVIYKVADSSGNEASVERAVEVVKKPPANQKIAVINYHFFYTTYDDWCHESICLQIDKFKEQLQWLKDNNYYTLTMDEFVRWMYGELEVPEKSVLLTVDDGAKGTSKINGNLLIPTLEEYDMYATLFLIAGWWGVDGGIENYRSDHLEIQSHTFDLHVAGNCGRRSKVNCISHEALVEDLKKSLEIVDNNDSFCFPFYDYTEASIKAVKEVGFKVSFIGGGRKASRNDDKYKIPRFPVQDYTSLETFKNWVS